MPDPAPPNDPQAQARAAKPHPPDAATGGQVTRRESIAGRMSPAAPLLGCTVLGLIGEEQDEFTYRVNLSIQGICLGGFQ